MEKVREFNFDNTCVEFHFNVKNNNELLFFTADKLFKLKYNKDYSSPETIYVFNEPLSD